MTKTNAIIIGIDTIDGDLLNDIFKILNRDFSKEDGYIVNRELHSDFCIFAIGNIFGKEIEYDKSSINKIIRSIVNELKLAVEEFPFISINNAYNINEKMYVYERYGRIIVDHLGSPINSVKYIYDEAVKASNRLLYEMNSNILFPAGTYANNDFIVEVYSGSQLVGIVPDEILQNAYRFLNSKDDKEPIKKTIQAIVDYHNGGSLLNSRANQTQTYNVTGYIGFQPIMIPVKNSQMPIYKPSPCPIVITVTDLSNNKKETMHYIAML